LKEQGIDEGTILKGQRSRMGGTDRINVAQERGRWQAYECGNEPLDSTKCREFLE
jgi:hypothetical protein